MLNSVSGLLTPSLLAATGCGTLGVGAVLFILSRRGNEMTIDFSVPLSWAEPVELRLVAYFLLGSVAGIAGLLLRLAFGTLTSTEFAAWALLVLVAIGFLMNLFFIYAAAGCLLQAAMGTRGRPAFWFTRLLSPLDGLIMDIGDVLAMLLFRPATVTEMRRRDGRYRYEDDLDYGDEYYRRPHRPARPRPVARAPRRRYEAEDGYYDPEYDRPAYQRAAVRGPISGTRYRTPPEERELDLGEEYEAGSADHPSSREQAMARAVRPRRPVNPASPEVAYEEFDSVEEEEAFARTPRRRARREPRDFPRERLDQVLLEYEEALTPGQLDRLREMRSLVDAIQQYN